MKNLLIIYAFLCLLTSCTNTDSDFDSIKISNVILIDKSENTQLNPENMSNPFDDKGKRYYNAIINYQNDNQFPNSINEMTGQIKYVSDQVFMKKMTQKRLIVFNDSIVQSIMSDPDNFMINIVQSSQLTSNAKVTLINFLQGLISHRQLDFTISYNYIVDYEGTIIGNSSFDEDETETILTIASISRYSLFSEAERKDKDWDLSAGNKPARKFFSTNDTSVISVIALLQSLI